MGDFLVKLTPVSDDGWGGCIGILIVIAVIGSIIFACISGVTSLLQGVLFAPQPPTPIQTIAPEYRIINLEAGNWNIVVEGLPNNLSVTSATVLQCRETAGSSELEQDYLLALEFENRQNTTWFAPKATLSLETSSGNVLKEYPIKFLVAYNSFDLATPSKIISASDSRVHTFRIRLLDSNKTNVSVNEASFFYTYTINIEDYSENMNWIAETFNTILYPEHEIKLTISNTGDLEMKDVSMIGILRDKDGYPIDILVTKDTVDIPFEQSYTFLLKSFNNRCINDSQSQPLILSYWVRYETLEGIPISYHGSFDISEPFVEETTIVQPEPSALSISTTATPHPSLSTVTPESIIFEWSYELENYSGSRYDVYSQIVIKVAPHMSWEQFKDDVLIYNPQLIQDQYEFKNDKTYLLPIEK
ncbi:MAG: hypothetical protein FJZ96_01045 [Chloroflexi bacterium]|nr:hypothetical protein [Chloroflexota bacterium]